MTEKHGDKPQDLRVLGKTVFGKPSEFGVAFDDRPGAPLENGVTGIRNTTPIKGEGEAIPQIHLPHLHFPGWAEFFILLCIYFMVCGVCFFVQTLADRDKRTYFTFMGVLLSPMPGFGAWMGWQSAKGIASCVRDCCDSHQNSAGMTGPTATTRRAEQSEVGVTSQQVSSMSPPREE
jgi:hypothetical protein